MFASPGEIAFSLFGYQVHWYGIIMAIAIIIGLYVISRIRKIYYIDIPQDFVLDLSFYLIIAGILGARLYYVLLDFKYYIKNPIEIFEVWHGGLSIHGTIIAAIVVGAIYIKKNKQKFLRIADLFIYGLIMGQSIGRWGNFFNSEAFGMPTNLPWKLFIAVSKRPLEFYNISYFHPTFLYESLANLIIFLILFFIVRKLAKGKDGIVFFSYLIMYSVARFFIESLRIDSILNIKSVPIAQLVSIIFIITGFIGILIIINKNKINHSHSNL